jgi:hypothetical protein
MNKISEISGSPPVSGPQKPEKPKSDLFQKNLEAARAKRLAAESQPPASAPLGEVSPPVMPTITTASAGIVDKTESLLEMLENYSQDMDDPKKSLKDIEPLIDTIQKEASKLAAEANQKVPEDTALKKIVDEFAVTANVEYMKFYRGDYV